MTQQELNRQHLRKMLDAIISEDVETAKAAFHDYVVNRSKDILEGACDPCDVKPAGGEGKSDPKAAKGDAGVKATMAKTAKEEIAKKGEAKADPKAAKGDAGVKATMAKTGNEEIPKKGEAKADPKAAKGDAGVKATMAKTAKEEIK